METKDEKFRRLRLEYHQKLIKEIIKPNLPIKCKKYDIVDVYEGDHGVQVVMQYHSGRRKIEYQNLRLDELEVICFAL